LTVVELRDLLRQHDAKVSGNKRELIERLQIILLQPDKNMNGATATETPTQQRSNNPTKKSNNSSNANTNGNGKKRKLLLEQYNKMTLKELKDLLREHKEKVSGNKRELVHRLMILGYESNIAKNGSQDGNPFNGGNDNDDDATPNDDNEGWAEEWAILDPKITFLQHDNSVTQEKTLNNNLTNAQQQLIDMDVELPTLSSLLFIHKPSGWSTLPTKQQLDNPDSKSTYPCLSDSVNRWLYTTSQGKEFLSKAKEEEDQWWETLLSSLQQQNRNTNSNNQRNSSSKLHKQWKRKRDKANEKNNKKSKTVFAPRPVHRLDIDTSGIVCVALTPYALRAANMMFERKSRSSSSNDGHNVATDDNGTIEESYNGTEEEEEVGVVRKRYEALVQGSLTTTTNSNEGIVQHAIGKVWINDHNEWACDINGDGTMPFLRPNPLEEIDDDDGKALSFVPGSLRDALTSYRVIEEVQFLPSSTNNAKDAKETTSVAATTANTTMTRVELTPHTGRGHQLRLHMSSLGHPIVGDDMHGTLASVSENDAKDSANAKYVNGGKLCLHASQLSMDIWCHASCSTSDYGDYEEEEDGFRICRVEVESPPPF